MAKIDKSVTVRMKESSQKLLTSMNKGGVDAGVKFIWVKLCKHGKEINKKAEEINKLKARIKHLDAIIDEYIKSTTDPKLVEILKKGSVDVTFERDINDKKN